MRNLIFALLFLPVLLCVAAVEIEASQGDGAFDPTGSVRMATERPDTGSASADASPVGAAASTANLVQYSTPVTPTQALLTSNGQIWYSSFFGGAIGELDPSTLLSRVYRLPESKSVFGIAQDAAGAIWYTTANAPGGNDTVGRLNPVSGLITEWTLPRSHFGLEIDRASQAVWFVSKGTTEDHLVRLSPQTNEMARWNISPYTDTYELDVAPNGDVWFTVQPRGLQGVGRLKPATGETTIWKLPSLTARPFQLRVVSDSEVWLTEFDATGNSVSRLSPATNRLARYTLPRADSGPAGLLLNGDELWFTEYRGGRIGVLRPASGSPQESTLEKVTYISPKTTGTVLPATVTPNVTKSLATVKTEQRHGVALGAFIEYALPDPDGAPLHIVRGQGNSVWFTESDALRITRLEPGEDEIPERRTFLPLLSK
jgi:streptogramin lyase